MAVDNHLHLKMALDDYLLQSIASLPAESELARLQSFSKNFEQRMKRLIRKAAIIEKTQQPRLNERPVSRPRSSSLKKKRLLLAAVILAILVSAMSVTAAREAVLGFLVRVYETFTSLVFDEGRDSQTPTTQNGSDPANKLPTRIPDGYAQADQLLTDGFRQIIYVNPAGEELIFECQAAANLQVLVDTENVAVEELNVSQSRGLYYSNKGVQNLIWQDGAYVFTISGKISKSELLFMAESTN